MLVGPSDSELKIKMTHTCRYSLPSHGEKTLITATSAIASYGSCITYYVFEAGGPCGNTNLLQYGRDRDARHQVLESYAVQYQSIKHLERWTAFSAHLAVKFTASHKSPYLHFSFSSEFSKNPQRAPQPPLPVDPLLHSRAPPVPPHLPYS